MNPARCGICGYPVKRWRAPYVVLTVRRWAHFNCFLRRGVVPMAEIRRLHGKDRTR